jgi:uncharacterized protein (UPF0332 family)
VPRDFIKTAEDLLDSTTGKPRQSNLRRATSTAYYALFHTLAKSCADLMVGGDGAVRSEAAWGQVYRALEHAFAKNACKNSTLISQFPKEIQDFANMFVQMQEKRHRADYDPNEKFLKSAVANDISGVEVAIDDFYKAPISDRRAFATLVLFKMRN